MYVARYRERKKKSKLYIYVYNFREDVPSLDVVHTTCAYLWPNSLFSDITCRNAQLVWNFKHKSSSQKQHTSEISVCFVLFVLFSVLSILFLKITDIKTFHCCYRNYSQSKVINSNSPFQSIFSTCLKRLWHTVIKNRQLLETTHLSLSDCGINQMITINLSCIQELVRKCRKANSFLKKKKVQHNNCCCAINRIITCDDKLRLLFPLHTHTVSNSLLIIQSHLK